ncbi:YigZ family protein [Pueribacillus theae]|uniref:YigZ family protein n=1 Tax=Pueribacillus theae TaxID=2171751 RepID=A0A2U1K540_9BACI|nr:YigZ family protein [Pueribacillus theae]PWA12636.1 YigZ family protein [Pueribacillus theae]
MLSSYYTVKQPGTHEIYIQKSRFIAYIGRAESEEEAQAFIQSIKKKHYDATHNCSAYLIGENNEIQKANDDGEPNGTAGIPILEVLKKRGLKDTVVVVTRYFGGIKLGTGGLIRAYGSAASEVIRTVGVVKRVLMQIMHTAFDYSYLGKIENELHNSPYEKKEIRYFEHVEMDIYVESGNQETFAEWITNLTNGEAEIGSGDVEYLEKEINKL